MYQTSVRGGEYPHFGKIPNYVRFLHLKASIKPLIFIYAISMILGLKTIICKGLNKQKIIKLFQVTLVESRTSTGLFRKEMRIEADPSDFK